MKNEKKTIYWKIQNIYLNISKKKNISKNGEKNKGNAFFFNKKKKTQY